MTAIRTLLSASAIALMTTAGVCAAPCAVGTTVDSTGKATTKDTSSNVDGGSSAKVTPGAKAESPGTVGALNNLGANTTPSKGEAAAPVGKVVKPGDTDC